MMLLITGVVMITSYYTFARGKGYIRTCGFIIMVMSYSSLNTIMFLNPITKKYAPYLIIMYPLLAYLLYIFVTKQCLGCPLGTICNKNTGLCDEVSVSQQSQTTLPSLSPGPSGYNIRTPEQIDQCLTICDDGSLCCGDNVTCSTVTENNLSFSTCCDNENTYFKQNPVDPTIMDPYCCPEGSKAYAQSDQRYPTDCVVKCGDSYCGLGENCATIDLSKVPSNQVDSTIKDINIKLSQNGVNRKITKIDDHTGAVCMTQKNVCTFNDTYSPGEESFCFLNQGTDKSSTSALLSDDSWRDKALSYAPVEGNSSTQYISSKTNDTCLGDDFITSCLLHLSDSQGLMDTFVDADNRVCNKVIDCDKKTNFCVSGDNCKNKYNDPSTNCSVDTNFFCTRDGHAYPNIIYYYDNDMLNKYYPNDFLQQSLTTAKTYDELMNSTCDTCECKTVPEYQGTPDDVIKIFTYSGPPVNQNDTYTACRNALNESLQQKLIPKPSKPTVNKQGEYINVNGCPESTFAIQQINDNEEGCSAWYSVCGHKPQLQYRCCTSDKSVFDWTKDQGVHVLPGNDSGVLAWDHDMYGCSDPERVDQNVAIDYSQYSRYFTGADTSGIPKYRLYCAHDGHVFSYPHDDDSQFNPNQNSETNPCCKKC